MRKFTYRPKRMSPLRSGTRKRSFYTYGDPRSNVDYRVLRLGNNVGHSR